MHSNDLLYAVDELRIKRTNDMDEKQRMINLLNYCFDNNIEPWNNQENIKTVESFIISIGGLANSSNDIQNVISTEQKPDKPTEAIDDAAKTIYQAGEMLRAVKYLNKYTNMKLKEAKEYADINY